MKTLWLALEDHPYAKERTGNARKGCGSLIFAQIEPRLWILFALWVFCPLKAPAYSESSYSTTTLSRVALFTTMQLRFGNAVVIIISLHGLT